MKTLVIIPAYNEEDNLPNLIKDVKKYKYDYLIINDCSSDNTVSLAKKNKYHILNLSVNLGLAGVTRVGFKYAYDNDYDCVINIDGDGQHQPSYVQTLINEIEQGNDYVVGSRYLEKEKPHNLRMLGSRIIVFLIKLKTGYKVSDPTSGMRAIGRKTIKLFAENMNFCAEPDALCYVLKRKLKVKEVQVEMEERIAGKSYFISPFKSIKYMFEVIISILIIQR